MTPEIISKKGLPLLLLYFLFLPVILFGGEYLIQPYGYSVDTPDGWEVLDAENPSLISFSDSTRTTIFQIQSFPGITYSSAAAMYSEIKEQLSAEGDGAGFVYSGRDAVFSDLSFSTGSLDVRGYCIFIDSDETDIFLMAVAGEQMYKEKHDSIISCLDSFSVGKTRRAPGPVSQFFSTENAEQPVRAEAFIGGRQLFWSFFPSAPEASQLFLEREARVLLSYENDRDEAWQRYYRMIYRDNYYRFEGLYRELEEFIDSRGIPAEQVPALLLPWLQDFTYARTGTLSDLLCPIAGAVTRSGDCDSRALIYIILLHYFGIDAILMVSSEYSHALAAVDVPGEGARFSLGGKQYLVAELTKQVPLGMIAGDMADSAKWLGVSFTR